jgi:hypothetical protein
MKFKSVRRCVCAGLLIGASAMASANTTYYVNLSNDTDTLTGTITTNGIAGPLLAENFLGFSFTDTDKTSLKSVFSLSAPNLASGDLVTCNSSVMGYGCGFWAVQAQQGFGAALIFDNVRGTGTKFASGSYSLAFNTDSLLFTDGNTSTQKTFNTLGDVGYLLVGVVPEPQTYVMFLSGLGIMGLIARRRRKS